MEQEWNFFISIQELKERGQWPIPWTAAMGLLPEIEKLGTNLVGCEIGVDFGFNMIYFLENSNNISKIYAIDPYIPYDDRITGGQLMTKEELEKRKNRFLLNSEPYNDKITFINKTSNDAVSDIEDNSLDYLFIDGDHNYYAVYQDMKNYYSKVKSGGIFAGHDLNSRGVQQAVTQFASEINLNLNKIMSCRHEVWFWVKD